MKAIKKYIKRFFSIEKLFSRCIVVGSLIYMVRVTEKVLDIAKTDGINLSSVLCAAGAVFGGELILLAFRDVISRKNENQKSGNGGEYSDEYEECVEKSLGSIAEKSSGCKKDIDAD